MAVSLPPTLEGSPPVGKAMGVDLEGGAKLVEMWHLFWGCFWKLHGAVWFPTFICTEYWLYSYTVIRTLKLCCSHFCYHHIVIHLLVYYKSSLAIVLLSWIKMTWTSEFVMSFAHPSRIDLHPFISSSRIKLKPLKMLNPLLQINAIRRRALPIRQDQHSLVGCHQFLHTEILGI